MKYHYVVLVLQCVMAALLSTGCTSFRSTIVNRLSNDSLRPQSETRTARGVPVKLKVPTHMEVRIVETYFLGSLPGQKVQTTSIADQQYKAKAVYDVSNGANLTVSELDKAAVDIKLNTETKTTPAIPTMFQPGKERGNRVLNVQTNLIYTDKVFTVDFPRSLAGTLSLTSDDGDGITFDQEQYFASIRGSYSEETLSTINSILEGQITQGVGTSAAGRTVEMDGAKFKPLTRVVAFDRFDISECGWEARMQAFVEQHLGACNPPCEANACPENSYPMGFQSGQLADEIVSPPALPSVIIDQTTGAANADGDGNALSVESYFGELNEPSS